MKKDTSECQQRILRKLFRNNKPQLPVMNIPGTRKATLPFPVGKRSTRSETFRVKHEKVPVNHSKPDNESIESKDNQSDAKNVPHSKSNIQMEALEGTEEKKKPRKKRISRALFRHDAIDYIKPKKQELLQKSFSMGFKKLVDKSKEIIFKNDDNENEDKTKEKDCENDNNIDKTNSKSAEITSGKSTQNMEHLLLDMPSLDSPCSSENIQQNTEQNNTRNLPKTSSTEAQIQLNYSQDLLYQFYGLIPNKPSTEQNDNEQTKKYNINIVPNTLKANEIDTRTAPLNASKELPIDQFMCPQNIVKHSFDARNQFIYPRFPYFHPNIYGYYGYPIIPQRYLHPQQTVKRIDKNMNNIENKVNCTVVKDSTSQNIKNNHSKTSFELNNFNSQIPLVQNIQHRHKNEVNFSSSLKRTAETIENNNNKRICINNNSNSSNNNLQTPINNTSKTANNNNEQSVIVSPKSNECSVIKKITSNKNQHTIENILAHKSSKEVNNNHKINIKNIEIIPETDIRYNNQKSVIISPKTGEKNSLNSLNNETNNIKQVKMPKLIRIPEEFHNSTNRNTNIIDTNTCTKLDAKMDTKLDPKMGTKSGTKLEAKTGTKSEAKSGTKSDAKSDAKSDCKTGTISDVKSSTKSGVKSVTKSGVKSGTNSDAKTGTKSDAKSGTKSDAKTGTKSDAEMGTKSDAKTGTKSDAKTGIKSDAKTGTKSDTKTGTKSDAKTGTKSNAEMGTKSDAKSGTKPVTKKAQNRPIHCDLFSKVNRECKLQLPLNLSLKHADERQPVIVNNTHNDPLNVDILTLVKSDEEYNGYLKLLEEKKATGPYLFYKFIASVRKKNNQPMFDLLTFFVLLKQGKLVDYKNMYNNCFK